MPNSLIKTLRRRNIVLSLNGDKLGFKAPEGAMTAELKAQLRDQKPALIECLQAQPELFNARALSVNERALWFTYRMNPTSIAYNMAYAVKLKQGLAVESVEQAFQTLLQAYPILRSAYGEIEGEPVQWVGQSASHHVAPTSHQAVPTLFVEHSEQLDNDAIQSWLAQRADQPFKLEEGDVCRGYLLVNQNGGQTEQYLLLTAHHIAADFISFEKIRHDLLALLNGEDDTLDTLAYQYRDWAAEQAIRTQNSDASLSYWLNALGDVPQLQLPLDYQPTADTGQSGEELSFYLNSETSASIRALCRDASITPYVWWMSAFQWFMGRLSGQEEFVIGTPSSGRLKKDHTELVGYLVNPLALRCQLQTGVPFAQWLQQVKAQINQAMQHQAYPFASLVEQLNLPRQAGRSPVFQHMFTLNHERPDALKDNLVEAELLAEQRGAAHELNLVVVDNQQDFMGKWRYNDALFKREKVQTVVAMFEYFIEQLVEDQNLSLEQIALAKTGLSLSGELEQVVPQATAWQAFQNYCEVKPDALALQLADERLNYRQLLDRVEVCAAQLQQRGVVANDRVGLYIERSVEQVVVMLACWRLGAAYVAMDLGWPTQRLDFIKRDAQLRVTVGVGEAPAWLEQQADWFDLRTSVESDLSSSALPVVEQMVTPATPAYLIYTSGSTGQPKGVVVSQANLAHYVAAAMQRLDLPEQASLAALAGSGADLGYTATFGALLSGRVLQIIPEELALDADALAEHLQIYPVDCLKIVPSHMHGLLKATQSHHVLPQHTLLCGGEALTTELVQQVKQRQPNVRVVNHYGPTETTVGIVADEVNAEQPHIALGRPLAGVSVRVVDYCGHVVVQGFPGELQVSGPTVAQGYWQQQSLTKERFLQEEKVWYRTGDKVTWQNGQLFFIGRTDFQVKVRGFRVELGEVEAWLNQQGAQAVVLNVPDERNNNRLVAYLVTTKDEALALREAMQSQLPDYMIPARWLVLEQLPRLGNGKVDRTALAQLNVEDCILQTSDLGSGEGQPEPMSPVESALLDVWRILLNRPELGIHDNFFAHGGDSILGLQIIAKAKESGIKLTPKDIFEQQTIAELALVAEVEGSEVEKCLLAIAREVLGKPSLSARDNFFQVGGDSILSLQIIAKAKAQGVVVTPKQVFEHQTMAELANVAQVLEAGSTTETANQSTKPESRLEYFPLTPIQHWFMQQQQSQPQHWNQSLLMQCAQTLDMTALRHAVAQLVQHHDSLRLAFVKEGDTWQQTYQTWQDEWLDELVQVSAHEVSDTQLADYQGQFSLSEAPLLRFVWFTPSQQLLCCAHHLIVDAVSWQIVLQDLQNLYQTALNQISVRLPATTSGLDAWQKYLGEWANALPQQEIDFWREQHEAQQPKADAENLYRHSAHCQLELDQDTTQRLLTESHQAYRTRIHEILLTALVQTLGHAKGLQHIAVELEGHGRETEQSDLDLSRSIGWFTSRFPLRLPVLSQPEQAIPAVKEAYRNIPNNGLSYGLARYLADAKGQQPWPDTSLVTFNYLGQQTIAMGSNNEGALWQLAQPLCPAMRADDNHRTHLLDVNALVLNGCLVVDFHYPTEHPEFVEAPDLVEQFADNLRNLVEHCCSPSAGRATASDFPEAGIDDAAFLALLKELQAAQLDLVSDS
ncbi:non-ribosomal peptide synthetase [Marinomonas sp. FW-1]|uniref:non-ribosomal peptide synthetase n=1 Tax=Marinomonas sp. FW-1 TaxID=2071621 RepID=UPI0010C0BC2C|nr:non-ribosomal peptide synthetase [Marinomonas sp. FW-1]